MRRGGGGGALISKGRGGDGFDTHPGGSEKNPGGQSPREDAIIVVGATHFEWRAGGDPPGPAWDFSRSGV